MRARREAEHGTRLRYQRDGCRCAKCREANAMAARERRARCGTPPRKGSNVEAERRYNAKRTLARRMKTTMAGVATRVQVVAVRRHHCGDEET